MALIPNKREFLARCARRTGLLELLERSARRPCLLVLTYHRIGDAGTTPYYGPVYSASAADFAAEVRAVRDRYRVLTLDDTIALSGDQFLGLREPSLLITLDDGYRDNFDVAFPILRDLNVPATFFLPTGFMRDPRLPWWDHIAHVINCSKEPVLRLDWPEPLAIDLGQAPRASSIARVVQTYLAHHVADEDRFRAHVEERAGVTVDEPALGRALFMSWDDARALAAGGMGVGSHGNRHLELARLSEKEQQNELAESKRILESELGRATAALAYPYGWPGTFDATTQQLAGEEGYQVAFASTEGVNRPGSIDRFAVRRIGVGFADSPTLLRARLAMYASIGKSLL
jgi:peptidoglycan/xylan/chitin deacetylase (PgdA/CDA1 family)